MLYFFDVPARLNDLKDAFLGSTAEVAQTVADEVQEEIKEIAKSPSIVDATKSVAIGIAEEAAPLVPAIFRPAIDQCTFEDRPSQLALLNNTLEYCLPELNSTAKEAVQQGSSYLPHLAVAAGLFGAGFTAYKMRGTKATLQSLMKDKEAYGVIEGSVEILKALNELMKNPVVLELIKVLTPAQANMLVKGKDLLAEIAADKDVGQQLLGLQQLVTTTPVASSVPSSVVDLDSVLRQVAASSSSSVDVTESAPKADLAASILTSEAGKQVLAKIRASESSNAVLEKMNEKSLKTLNANASKWIASPKFATMNAATLAGLLVQVAGTCGQTIELEAKKPAVKLK